MSVTAIANAAAAVVTSMMQPDICDVQSLIGAAGDSAGGSTGGTWTTHASVPCQVSAITSRTATVAEKLAKVADLQVSLPAGTPITTAQRIKHTRGATVTYYTPVGALGEDSGSSPTFQLDRTVLVQLVQP